MLEKRLSVALSDEDLIPRFVNYGKFADFPKETTNEIEFKEGMIGLSETHLYLVEGKSSDKTIENKICIPISEMREVGIHFQALPEWKNEIEGYMKLQLEYQDRICVIKIKDAENKNDIQSLYSSLVKQGVAKCPETDRQKSSLGTRDRRIVKAFPLSKIEDPNIEWWEELPESWSWLTLLSAFAFPVH